MAPGKKKGSPGELAELALLTGPSMAHARACVGSPSPRGTLTMIEYILPTAEFRGMEEDPDDFTVTVNSVLSNDKLFLAASGGFYEGDAEAGGEEDGEKHGQDIRAVSLMTKIDGNTQP